MAAVTALDVPNNALFRKGKLLGEPAEGAPPLALWNGQQYCVIRFTRCNGYAGVLLLVLGVPIPWMTANEYAVWFAGEAAKALGWRKIDLVEAVDRANAGFPVVIVATDNPHGHIGVGVPSPGSDPMTLYCTAAGAANTSRQRFVDQFAQLSGRAGFYTHD